MRVVLKYLLITVGTVFFLLRLFVDWVGRSTFFDDWNLLQSKAQPMIEMVGGISALGFYSLALVMIATGIALFFTEEIRSVLGALDSSTPYGNERRETLPGFSFATVVSIGTANAHRNRFIYSAAFQCGGAVDVYLSPSQRLVFRITDQHGEQHATEVKMPMRLRFREKRAIFLTFGTGANFSVSGIWVDGVRVALRRFEFAITIGSLVDGSVVMCADQSLKNHAEMQLFLLATFPAHLAATDRKGLFRAMKSIQRNDDASLVFDGEAAFYTSMRRDRTRDSDAAPAK